MERKQITTRMNNKDIPQIREWLTEGYEVLVVNGYDTFYGEGFGNWLKKGLEGLEYEYNVTCWNHWYAGIEWEIVVTPKQK